MNTSSPFLSPPSFLHSPSSDLTRHTFEVTRPLLLHLYDHTLKVKVWNKKEKLSPQARFDRPKAFRIPATKKDAEEGRRAKFALVGQETERVSRTGRRKGRGRRRERERESGSFVSGISEEESDLELELSRGEEEREREGGSE